MAPDSAEHVARIYNAAWMVRNYVRGGRTSIHKRERAEAIRRMGLVVREAFNSTDDFEPLLVAVYDGLSSKEVPPF